MSWVTLGMDYKLKRESESCMYWTHLSRASLDTSMKRTPIFNVDIDSPKANSCQIGFPVMMILFLSGDKLNSNVMYISDKIRYGKTFTFSVASVSENSNSPSFIQIATSRQRPFLETSQAFPLMISLALGFFHWLIKRKLIERGTFRWLKALLSMEICFLLFILPYGTIISLLKRTRIMRKVEITDGRSP